MLSMAYLIRGPIPDADGHLSKTKAYPRQCVVAGTPQHGKSLHRWDTASAIQNGRIVRNSRPVFGHDTFVAADFHKA